MLFDFDGVLADSERGAFTFLQKTLAGAYGVTVPAEDQSHFIGHGGRAVVEEIISRYKLSATVEEFMEQRQKHGNFYEDSEVLEPMPGALEFLTILRENGVRTALVSSTGSRLILSALNRMGMARCFDAIVCGDMVAHTKPHPEPYQKALSLLGEDPACCIAVEDSPFGVRAALDAGLTVVGFHGSGIDLDTSAAQMQAAHFSDCFDLSRLEALLNTATVL